jgi:RNA polymerase sigma factor (sigma-70 family)
MTPAPGPRSRSDRAFERLYRRHVDDVFRYALAVLTNRSDAEDVTQTTFLNAYRAFKAGRPPEQPLNWLITIAHNVCRQRFRAAARRPSEVELDRELAVESRGDEGIRYEDIRRALSQLTFNQRSALAMRELEGRSYQEIAETLGVTQAAVETLIFRARRTFREQLEGSLTCGEAERLISRELDGMLARGEKSALRAHLRACPECATLARRFRAQRAGLRGIALVPLPQALTSFSHGGAGTGLAGGGTALGASLGIKALALGAAALVVAGVSTEVVVTSSGGRHAPPVVRADRPASAHVPASLVLPKPAVAAGAASRVRRLHVLPAKPQRTAHPAHRAATPAGAPSPAAVAPNRGGGLGHAHAEAGGRAGGAQGQAAQRSHGAWKQAGTHSSSTSAQRSHGAWKQAGTHSASTSAHRSHGTGRPASAGRPATTPGGRKQSAAGNQPVAGKQSAAKHQTGKDKSAGNGRNPQPQASGAPATPDPPTKPAPAVAPPGTPADVPAGPPADPGSAAASHSDQPRKR